MECKRCGTELAPEMKYCWNCGRKQVRENNPRQRGNGQGSVYKLPNGKYKAVVILGYYRDAEGKKRKKTRSKVFALKKDAIAALPGLTNTPSKKQNGTITFKALYDKWYPTHRAGDSTLGNYRAAFKYFESLWFMPMQDISIDDLQECMDDCPRGQRTKQNMKAVCGLVYKFGIPRGAVPEKLNLAEYLIVDGDATKHRVSFTSEQIESLKNQIGKIDRAEYIYCLIYLGFRPSEFLALQVQDYDPARKCFVGGAKTDAGTNRVVTISPKIQPYIDSLVSGRKDGAVFRNADGQRYTLRNFTEALFYPVVDAAGIPNPLIDVGGGQMRHKYTPHSCRHTFSTLMKAVNAPSKDKLELIGHTSEEMLRYYQDVDVADLRKITDAL